MSVPILAYVFAGVFLLGLVLGVRAMLQGVERSGGQRFALNGPTLAAFAIACGATGYLLTRHMRLSPGVEVAIAGTAGLGGALGALGLVAAWAIPAARAESVDERYLLQGALGRVLSTAADGTAGIIRYEAGGATRTSPATGLDGVRLEAGADVVIERIEAGVAYVEPWARVEARL